MSIRIEKLSERHAQSLFKFECDNRRFFETMVPGRGDDYYIYSHFLNNLESLLLEQENGLSIFHLIFVGHHAIAGRINLADIAMESTGRKADLGYRVGRNHLQKGIAATALKYILALSADEYEINKILAKTTNKNIASQKVLEKNGFELDSIDNEAITLNGEKLSFYNYSWAG
ncbi:GNAT family N-acetyltransferase [Peribacillus deserti]|uniref:GNAT family N-acetyltransferase n=1 Tax=Peribacillus deserti TaxID=673318 RepID=A0A2N5M7Z2_9BACI|nr:GNAT family protein [Peribacillus deserti]PLT30480.1 GNAT family N-acetyltransferase [Peribacillus deserti]